MRKTFQFRVFPTKRQQTLMLKTLNECRWLYNHLLEERKTAYEERGESLVSLRTARDFWRVEEGA